MPAGRPPEYDPSYCEIVIKLGAEGASHAQMARELGVSRQSLYTWAERYPEFMDAVARARDLSLAWWEGVGQKAASGELDRANAMIWTKSMAARFPEDYMDKSRVEHLGLPSARDMGVEDLLAELRNFTAVLGLDRAPLTIDMEVVQDDADPIERDTDAAKD